MTTMSQAAMSQAMIPQSLLTRLLVEDFVRQEAELLDQWKLDEWLALYTEDCRYEVGPTGKANAAELSPETSMFLIADNRFRLEQRVIRMKKPTAHAEYPHSRTRHLYTNVRILEDSGSTVTAELNFATHRAAKGTMMTYWGIIRYVLQAQESADGRVFKVSRKRITLDLDSLVPHGKVTIFL